MAGAPDPQKANALKKERVGPIVEALRSTYDYVLLDIGRSPSRVSLPLLQQADLIALVLSADHGTPGLAKIIFDYLQSQGIADQKIFTILNHARDSESPPNVDAEEITGLPIKTTLPHIGGAPALANHLNQPISIKYPNDTVSILINDLALEVARVSRLPRSM